MRSAEGRSGQMTLFLIGMILFIGAHLIPALTSIKQKVAESSGVLAGKALVAVPSLVGLFLIIWGYSDAKAVSSTLYLPPEWLKHITWLLMWPALIVLTTSNLHGRISKAVQHPQLLAVKIWAFAHLLSNGLLAQVILFGGFLAWAVIARISAKKRQRAGVLNPAPGGPLRNDLIAVAAGTVLYVVFLLWAHEWLFGVSPTG